MQILVLDIDSMTSRFGGRPKLSRQHIRDQRVVTFLTRGEYKTLLKIAGETSVSVSRACHDLIVRGMKRVDTSRKDTRSSQGRNK